MRGALFMVASLSLWMLPASSPAQLGLPGRLGVPDVLDGVESLPGRLPLPDIERLSPVRAARTLLDARTQRLADLVRRHRSEEHTSELQSLMRNSYAVFCLKKN